jgi:hypothetical protein
MRALVCIFNMVPRESWQASIVAERGARTTQKRRGAAPRRAFFAFIGSPPRYIVGNAM